MMMVIFTIQIRCNLVRNSIVKQKLSFSILNGTMNSNIKFFVDSLHSAIRYIISKITEF